MKKTLFTFLFALLFYAQANAQSNDLALLYQSPEGTRPAAGLQSAQGGMSGFSDRLDFDGDGIPDLIMTREDEQGNLQHILVINAQTQQVLWEVRDVQRTLGFVDPDMGDIFTFDDVVGDDAPEAIFTSEHDVRLYDPSNNTLVWSVTADDDWTFPEGIKVRLLAAIDFTGDDKKELLIFLPDTKELQVWHEKLP